MQPFQYHSQILETFPSLVGGVVLAENIINGPSSEALQREFLAEQTAVLARLGGGSLGQIPALGAWRSAFRKFGVEPTQYRPSSEALLRRLQKKGDIPSINTLVDLGNLISIRYALPIAVIDRGALQGVLSVHFADGTERYTPLHQEDSKTPDVGEVVFTDETKQVMARRWCWRQSQESAAGADTTAILVTLEGHHDTAAEDVQAAINDLTALLQTHTTAICSSYILKSG